MSFLSPEINVVKKICEKTRKLIVRDFGEIESLQVSKKGIGDFVTKVDKKVEKIIFENLEKVTPKYSIVGEEGSSKIGEDKEFKWIIDPIDGTTNLVHGIPHFSISIALEKNNEIISGVIYDPIKDEMFIAEKGRGAYLNNRRIRVSKRNKIEDSLGLTGGPAQKDSDKNIFYKEYEEICNVVQQVRRLGSAALDLAYVACGRAEFFWHKNLKYWDIASGLILVKEAGGSINNFRGEEFNLKENKLLASNNLIDKDLIKITSKF
jgi:myo-inositol-1(or 4)-monophosphatase